MARKKEEGKEGLSITIWAGGALRDVEETERREALFSRHFYQVGHHPEPPDHHQHQEDQGSSTHATFTRLEVPRPSCSPDWTSLVALSLSGAPFGVLPETKGLGDRWESPSKCPFNWVRAGRHWPARRSPGGRRSRGPVVMGGEELARGWHSGGVPLLKTRGVAGIVCFVRK